MEVANNRLSALESEKSALTLLRKTGVFLTNGMLMLFTLSCVFPIVWLSYSSLKTKEEFAGSIVSLPKTLQFSNYVEAFRTIQMELLIFNSIRNTVISVLFVVVISFVTGYFLSRFEFRGKRLIYYYYVFGLLVPIHALLVPVYLLFNKTGMVNQWYTLLIPLIGYSLSFPIFLVESYIRGIPREMEEAAAIDGCSFARTLFTIIFPMTMPAVTTVAILQFFACWNEFSFALILINDEHLRTVPLGLTSFGNRYDTNYPLLMAAMMIALLPVALVYFSFSSKIIKGVGAGSVKG
ncbi:carbohydrate ABC transporter permease [Paenibacillus sp.]|uniref:carbohydrate ABC transporter permease n=1 Tax=Paenibacillus sp. TaxID=58172 RepID=UPI002D4052CD|nr:carbohydrate ABC transporter permease [Paenibacillus sp.]HZG85806.1 carbohydrate ABC transporter permease [Paenibacillus sp.]